MHIRLRCAIFIFQTTSSVGPIPAELHANFSYGFVTETLTSKLLKEPIYLAAKWYFETLTCEQQDYLKSNFGVNFEEPTFKAKGSKKTSDKHNQEVHKKSKVLNSKRVSP